MRGRITMLIRIPAVQRYSLCAFKWQVGKETTMAELLNQKIDGACPECQRPLRFTLGDVQAGRTGLSH